MKKTNNPIKVVIMALVGIILLVGIMLVVERINSDLAPEDSSALFGGEIEYGYPYAGYMLNVAAEGGINICSVTYLSKDIGVTAAHCVLPGSTVYTGYSAFSANNLDNAKADTFHTRPGWDFKTSNNDFAVIELGSKDLGVPSFAQVSTPQLGCNYVVVAYGRTEDETSINLNNRLRKSATMCITNIEKDLFYIAGSGGGICFGDSGSAIFERDTNKLVGVVSAIISANAGQQAKCALDNQAVVARADYNLGFISNYANIAPFVDTAAIACNDATCSNITNTSSGTPSTLVDRFVGSNNGGLNVYEQVLGQELSDTTNVLITIMLIAVVSLVAILALNALGVFEQKQKEAQPEEFESIYY